MGNWRLHRSTCLLLAALSLGALAVAGLGECHAQALVYSLDATANGLAAGEHRFGFRDEASNGPDLFDAPEPPPPPATFLCLAFAMPDTGFAQPNRWRADIRSSECFVDMVELWELHITSDQLGAEGTMVLDIVEGGEFELTLRVLGFEPGEFTVPVPGSFTFLLSEPEIVIWLELTADEPIPSSAVTWGGIKARYR